jgi:geranylgeranyl pyrophosphate synthase
VQSLAAYGRNAGIAFQITDDLLDVVGEQDKTGKPVGSDLDHNKLTLPLIHFLKTAGEADKQKVKQILSYKTGDAERMELLEKLNSCKSIEYSRRRAKEFVEGAIAALAAVADSDGNKALVETARFVAGRMV